MGIVQRRGRGRARAARQTVGARRELLGHRGAVPGRVELRRAHGEVDGELARCVFFSADARVVSGGGGGVRSEFLSSVFRNDATDTSSPLSLTFSVLLPSPLLLLPQRNASRTAPWTEASCTSRPRSTRRPSARSTRRAAARTGTTKRSSSGRARNPSNASSAFTYTVVPVRPRRRGERRSLRTFPVASLRPGSLAFKPDAPRRLSTPQV